MVKVLISADWHIGKRLHQVDLKEDLLLFFDWLLDYIEKNNISYLLVSGDIFDHSNPSQEAQEVYYNFLKRLYITDCKAIITAGNHDSPGFLEVGKSLATLANAHVVGYYPGIDEVESIFFELKDTDGVSHAVVAAIPFIADRFARQVGEGEGAAELAEKLKLVEEKDRVRNFQPPVSGQLIMDTFDIGPCAAIGTIKMQIKDAILEGHIPNEPKEAIEEMLRIGASLGLIVHRQPVLSE